MKQNAADEFPDAQLHRLELLATAADAESEGSALAIELQEPLVLDRPTADVAGQVSGDATAVAVAPSAVDDPFLAPSPADELLGLKTGHVGRQLEPALIEKALKGFGESLAQPVSDQLGREEGVVARRLPPPVRRDTAGGHEAVDMDVGPQRSRPGVKVEDEPGLGAEELGHLEYREQALPNGLEEKIADEAFVETPEDAQLSGQSAGDVVVVGG